MFTAYKYENGTLVEVSQDEALQELGVTAEEIAKLLDWVEETYMTYEKFLEEPVADYYSSILAFMPQEYRQFVMEVEKVLIKYPDLWENFLNTVEIGKDNYEVLGLTSLCDDQRMNMYLSSYAAYKVMGN